MISGDLTIAQLLDAHPELVDVLAGYHPHFKHLRNRLLRRVMAPRVTVAHAARIAGVATDELLVVLRRAVGEPTPTIERVGAGGAGLPASVSPKPEAPAPCMPRPDELDDLTPVRLDVRDDIRQGREPFARIMAAVKALAESEALVLRAPFEPIPLYDVLGKRGFAHWTERHADDDWSVWFYRETGGAERPGPGAGPATREPPPVSTSDPRRIVVDVRGLEPPQPMVLVLERLKRLPVGGRLEVIHDRRPMFLYPQLDERGFGHATDEPGPGLVRIVIWRKDGTR